MRTRAWIAWMGAVSACLASSGWAREADACGGVFCNGCNGSSGPVQQTVSQTGETVAFVMEPGKVEAHVRIEYTGDAQKFGWVIPLQSLPEIEVGSEAFFQFLLGRTRPSFTYTSTSVCSSTSPSPGGNGCATPGYGTAGTGSAGAAPGGPTSSGPEVVLSKTVGAFDVVVLSGGTADEVAKWLDDNGFAESPEAPPILEKYLTKGYLFAAVRLTGHAGAGAIHPLVFRYAGSAPCVPLELTRIAAKEDMMVRALFLGERRVLPSNYRHVVLSPFAIDWTQVAATYDDAIARAVDAPVADGRAFVTEWAGKHHISQPIASPIWSSAAYAGVSAGNAAKLIAAQGLLSCGACPSGCTFTHPLVAGIVQSRFQLSPGDEASQLCAAAKNGAPIEYTTGDADLAADLETLVFAPAKRADAAIAGHPYLTGLVTAISPNEMTEDPEFVEGAASLPDVGGFGAGVLGTCFGKNDSFTLAGTKLCLPNGSWPTNVKLDAARRIELAKADGTLQVLVDRSDEITAEIKAYASSCSSAYQADCLPGAAGKGGGGKGGAAGAVYDGPPPPPELDSDGGCSIDKRPGWGWLALVAAAGACRGTRRRRRRARRAR